MAEIKVTPAVVRSKAEELKGLNGQMKSKVEELTSSEQLLVSMWEGEAKTAFHTAFNNDKSQWETFYNLIEQYVVTLTNIAIEYENKEKMNAEIATSRSYK